MITGIPSSTSFRQASDEFFNIAWDRVYELSAFLNEFPLDEDAETEKADYWRAAQTKLKSAFIVLQQGVEFALKARIRKRSAFLLLDLSHLPKQASLRHVSFHEFKTIDANDLVKVANTFCKERLPKEFEILFGDTRSMRNVLAHTVSKKMKLAEMDIYKRILEFYFLLYGPAKWVGTRSAYLDSTEASTLGATEHLPAKLFNEINYVSKFLTNSEWERFLGVKKKDRRYICVNCYCSTEPEFYLDGYPNLAYLNSAYPGHVHCIICRELTPVVRTKCTQEQCKSNVLTEDGTCLLCYDEG